MHMDDYGWRRPALKCCSADRRHATTPTRPFGRHASPLVGAGSIKSRSRFSRSLGRRGRRRRGAFAAPSDLRPFSIPCPSCLHAAAAAAAAAASAASKASALRRNATRMTRQRRDPARIIAAHQRAGKSVGAPRDGEFFLLSHLYIYI